MPSSPRWSSRSASCPIEWHPSRWLGACLLLLAAGAVLSLLASDLPPVAARLLACVAAGHGAWVLVREQRRAPVEVWLNGGVLRVAGVEATEYELRWRGPVAFLAWREGPGRPRRLVWWPDTLPAARRRELRLAAAVRKSTRRAASMAP